MTNLERARAGRADVEIGVVNDDIALDLTHALLPDLPHQQPEALNDQVGIATALEVQVALSGEVVVVEAQLVLVQLDS